MWLNLYGHQAVQRKLKKGVKTQKMHFYPFFELNFREKILKIGVVENLSFFELAILIFFFKTKIFFCFIPIQISQNL